MTNNPSPMRLTCEPCRDRKVKCDRLFPQCSLCVRLGYPCSYRDRVRNRSRQDAVIRQLQERVRQTEALLARRTDGSSSSSSTRCSISEDTNDNNLPTEANLLLAASTSLAPPKTPSLPSPTPTTQSTPQVMTRDFFASTDDILASPERGFMPSLGAGPTAFPGFDMNLNLDMPLPFSFPEPADMPMGLEEDVPPPLASSAGGLSTELLAHLQDVFFQNFSPALPIIAKDSFYRRLAESPDSLSTRCISYSVALLGTVVSEQCRHWAKSCYTLARQYVDACECDEMADSLASISLLQALLCLTRFDIGRRNCARAYITLSRAARLAAMMQLEQMDQVQTEKAPKPGVASAVRIRLQSTHDLLDLEERRRCFWGLYILEGYASIHSGISCVSSPTNLFLFLPCPGALDHTFNPQSMPYLDGMAEHDTSDTISPFAGLVIVVSLIEKVLSHVSRTKLSEPGFWDRHYALVKAIEVHGALLKPLFALRTLYSDAVALDVYLSFSAVTMLLYQTSVRQGEQQGIASDMLASDAKKRLLSTALKVASTVKSMWAMQKKNIDSLSLSGAFVAWPLSLAIQVLRQNVLTGDNDYVEHIHMLHSSLGDVEYTNGTWHRQVEGSAVDEY